MGGRGRVHKPFSFKYFVVHHKNCAHRMGLDAMVLGSLLSNFIRMRPHVLATPLRSVRALDIGTGSGVLALMAAQQLSQSAASFRVDAVEVDGDSFRAAQSNFAASPWSQHMHVTQQSIQAFHRARSSSSFSSSGSSGSSSSSSSSANSSNNSSSSNSSSGGDENRFDVIVCNPPFFPDFQRRGTGSDVDRHKRARLDVFMPKNELMQAAVDLLRPGAQLWVIYPWFEAQEVVRAADAVRSWRHSGGMHRLALRSQTDIVFKEGKEPSRAVLQFCCSEEAPLGHGEDELEEGVPSELFAPLNWHRDARHKHWTGTLVVGTADAKWQHDYIDLTRDFYNVDLTNHPCGVA